MKYLLPLLMFLVGPIAQAKVVNYDKSTVVVTIPFEKETLFRFDMQVRTISPVTSYSLEPTNADSKDYSVLKVTPRDPDGDAFIAVILEDDFAVKIRIKTVHAAKNDLADPIIDFQRADSVSDLSPEASTARASELDLMKALIRDDYISGFERREVDRVVPTAQKGVSTRLIRHFESDGMQGYVFRVTNQMEMSSLTIDLRQLKLGRPNVAILSNADKYLLKGKMHGGNEALVRVVAKGSARFNDVRIPFGVRKPESEAKK